MSREIDVFPERKVDLGKQIVIFIGPEGSGKTSIAKRLAAESGTPYIATGDILRDMAKNDKTEYGDACRAMLAEHRYLESKTLLAILVKRFSQDDLKEGFILDGGLRTVGETEGFQSVLEKADRIMPITAVFLRIPGWMSFQRLMSEKNLRKREDDTVEGILNRLSNYYNQLGRRADLIKKQKDWRLLHINAMGNIEDVFNDVRAKIAK